MIERRRYIHRPKCHLTPIENITSIRKHGILTEKDARGQGRVWLCDFDKIEEVAYHLLSVKKITYCRFMVYDVLWWALPTHLRRTPQEGRYFVTCDIPRALFHTNFTFEADRFPADQAGKPV